MQNMKIISILFLAIGATALGADNDEGNSRSLRGLSSSVGSFQDYVEETLTCRGNRSRCINSFQCCDGLSCQRNVICNDPSRPGCYFGTQCLPGSDNAKLSEFESSFETEKLTPSCSTSSDCPGNSQCIDKSGGNCFNPPCGRCLSPLDNEDRVSKEESAIQVLDDENNEAIDSFEDEPEDFLDVGCIIGPQATCKCRRSRCNSHNECCSRMCRFTGRTYFQCV